MLLNAERKCRLERRKKQQNKRQTSEVKSEPEPGEEETEHVALVPQWFGLQQDTEEEDMYERKGSAFSVDDRQEYTPYRHRNKWYD